MIPRNEFENLKETSIILVQMNIVWAKLEVKQRHL